MKKWQTSGERGKKGIRKHRKKRGNLYVEKREKTRVCHRAAGPVRENILCFGGGCTCLSLYLSLRLSTSFFFFSLPFCFSLRLCSFCSTGEIIPIDHRPGFRHRRRGKCCTYFPRRLLVCDVFVLRRGPEKSNAKRNGERKKKKKSASV